MRPLAATALLASLATAQTIPSPTIAAADVAMHAKKLIWGPDSQALELFCNMKHLCKLEQLSIAPLGVVSTSQTFPVKNENRVSVTWLSSKAILVENAVYESPSLARIQTLGTVPDYVSPTGSLAVWNYNNSWCARRITPSRWSEDCAATGAGTVLALGPDLVVVTQNGTIVIKTMAGAVFGRVKDPRPQFDEANVISPNLILLKSTGRTLLIRPDGSTASHVKFAEPISFDSAGDRILTVERRRQVSTAQTTKELASAISTLGLGVADQPTNTATFEVKELQSRKKCYRWSGPMNASSTALGALSPDGSQALFETDLGLKLVSIPKLCQ